MKEKRDRPHAWIVFTLALFVFAATAGQKSNGMNAGGMELPRTVGPWTRGQEIRTITPENIFAYMDGAGELYVGYRFDRLEVTEYAAADEKNILVEVYFMKTQDDAFGLLSLDWGGEPIDLREGGKMSPKDRAAWPSALYGEGLLRLRSGTIYARIMAEKETPRSKEAVLALGRTVVKDGAGFPSPALLRQLPDVIRPEWKQRRGLTSFFRSHLVLNSLYYLSRENMFELGPETEAAIALYEKESPAGLQRIRILLIRYPDPEAAQEALAHFRRAYLPDQSPSSRESLNFVKVEDGWLGYKRSGRQTALVFECPNRETAAAVLDEL